MRTALFLLLPLFTNSACAQMLREVKRDFSSSLPPIEVYDLGMTKASGPSIVIAQEVMDGWNFLYLHITDTEFALCLDGTGDPNRITITGFRLAHILESNSSHIEYVPCAGPNYVGSAHNHPSNDYPGWDPCHHSAVDQRSFRKDKKASIDIVICGRDRFVWVLKDSDTEPRLWHTVTTMTSRREH